MITDMTADALYAEAIRIYETETVITPDQEAALKRAATAHKAAHEALGEARRSRKDKAERVASAEAMVAVAEAAYKAAQLPEKEAEAARYRAARAVAEKALALMAVEAFGGPVRYVNVVPTGETVTDYYGTREVMRRTVDDEPVTGRVVGFESGDRRIRVSDSLTNLTFEVQTLTDETYENGVRKDRFGYSADVTSRRGWSDETRVVEVSIGGIGSTSIEDAEVRRDLLDFAVRLARIVERVTVAA